MDIQAIGAGMILLSAVYVVLSYLMGHTIITYMAIVFFTAGVLLIAADD